MAQCTTSTHGGDLPGAAHIDLGCLLRLARHLPVEGSDDGFDLRGRTLQVTPQVSGGRLGSGIPAITQQIPKL